MLRLLFFGLTVEEKKEVEKLFVKKVFADLKLAIASLTMEAPKKESYFVTNSIG